MRDLETTYPNPAGTIDQVIARAKMFCTGAAIPERSKVEVNGDTFIVDFADGASFRSADP